MIVYGEAGEIDATPSQVVLISHTQEEEDSVSSLPVSPAGEEEDALPVTFNTEDVDVEKNS